MKKIKVYLAISLDGYVARRDKDVSWLGGDGSDAENMGSYEEFFQSVDTVVMGRTTYEQVITELAPGNWPYEGKQSYVVTSKVEPDQKEITFTSDLLGLLEKLKSAEGADIWIMGGAKLVQQVIRAGLVDELIVSVMPVLLGEGIRLWEEPGVETKLKLKLTRNYNGIVDLVYERRE